MFVHARSGLGFSVYTELVSIDVIIFPDKPFCKPGQVKVYGVAKRERIQVSCDIIANPAQNLKFEWVFNSSSERLDVQENLIRTSGTRSVADHMPQVSSISAEAVAVLTNLYHCNLQL